MCSLKIEQYFQSCFPSYVIGTIQFTINVILAGINSFLGFGFGVNEFNSNPASKHYKIHRFEKPSLNMLWFEIELQIPPRAQYFPTIEQFNFTLQTDINLVS